MTIDNKNKDEFYIGYFPKAPRAVAGALKWFVGIGLTVFIILALLIVSEQNEFADSTFELGTSTQIEGIYVSKPVPMLRRSIGFSQKQEEQFQNILLIGFGKSGAEKTIMEMKAKHGKELEGARVVFEGTLIYYDGKTLLELTKGVKSLISVAGPGPVVNRKWKALGTVSLRGEIVDPKCYFGVMKPGEGKVHRSCAIRCLSGGIPPVFKVVRVDGQREYYLLEGLSGRDLLDRVGQWIRVEGEAEELEDWKRLKIAGTSDIKKLTFRLSPDAMHRCSQAFVYK